MVYDDDVHNPIMSRIRERWGPSKRPKNSGVYRCGAATGDGSPCRRSKKNEPGYRCQDHVGQRSLLTGAR